MVSTASQSERAFITFLTNWIVSQSPGDLMTNLGALTTHMTTKMDPKSPENLHRKQYGNLKECIQASNAIKQIF